MNNSCISKIWGLGCIFFAKIFLIITIIACFLGMCSIFIYYFRSNFEIEKITGNWHRVKNSFWKDRFFGVLVVDRQQEFRYLVEERHKKLKEDLEKVKIIVARELLERTFFEMKESEIKKIIEKSLNCIYPKDC